MSRKAFVALVIVSLTCFLTVIFSSYRGVSAQISPVVTQVQLQPGVESFLRSSGGNVSVTEVPDPGETLEVLRSYSEFRSAPNSISNFRRLVEQNPNSRFARVGLAQAYYSQFIASQDKKDAALALQEQIAAAKIAFSYGKVFYASWIKQMALDAGQPEVASQWFDQVLAKDPNNYDINLNYGELLSTAGNNTKAEQFLLKAVSVRPTGNLDAPVTYSEFLLGNKRYQDALKYTTLVGERALYLDFLHGFALEKLGRGSEASPFYEKYSDMSRDFPVSLLFQILGSQYQKNISFEGSTASGSVSLKKDESLAFVSFSKSFTSQLVAQASATSATTNLSWVTACEAGPTESIGAQRMVAWSVRQRKNRGTIPSCLYVENSGNTDDQKYANVICQSSQYASITCNSSKNVTRCTNVNSRTATSNQVSYDVYNGYVPDPFNGWCPSGSPTSSSGCTAACVGGTASRGAFLQKTPHSFLAFPYTPPSCQRYASNVCGNGGSDNYFSYNP